MYIFPNDTASQAKQTKYLNALYSSNRCFGANVTLQYVKGPKYVNEINTIIGGGITYNASSTGTNAFNLGGANIDTATVELEYNGDNRANGIDGAREDVTFVELECGYGPAADDIVYIPLNVFTIQGKSTRIGENKYTLKLQSLMAKLDKNLPAVFSIVDEMQDEIVQYNTGGPTPFIILLWICKNVFLRGGLNSPTMIPIELSDKLYDSTFTAKLANWDKLFFINNNSGYTTYRDILKDVAAICGGFATFVYEGDWEFYDASSGYEGQVARVPSRLAIIPFVNYESEPYYLNNGTTSYTSPSPGEWDTSDIVSVFNEDLKAFKIQEVRYRAVQTTSEGDETTETEIIYDTPNIPLDYDYFYDISNLKILDTLYVDPELTDEQKLAIYTSVSSEIYNNIGFVLLDNNGEPTDVPNYQPIPYDITTTAPDFRFQLGDWVQTVSRLRKRSGAGYLSSVGQIMRIGWTSQKTCSYKSFNSPSANDRNASKRSSYADDGTPSGEGGTVPPGPEPEPPVIILDSEGQWLFGDEAELIEEAEAMARPGEIVHLSVVGQWNFGGSI